MDTSMSVQLCCTFCAPQGFYGVSAMSQARWDGTGRW